MNNINTTIIIITAACSVIYVSCFLLRLGFKQRVSNCRNLFRTAYISIFILIITLPFIILSAGWKKLSYAELKKIKFTDLDQIPDIVDKWYENNLGIKSEVRSFHANIKYFLFNETIDIDRCIAGKDGFLFLGNYYNKPVSISRNSEILSTKEHEDLTQSLSRLHGFLSSRKIKSYFMIAPNKHSIYPDMLPGWARPLGKPGMLNQFKLSLAKAGFPRSNIKDILLKLKNKDNRLLYHKTDTHWNKLASYHSYSYFIRQLNKVYDLKIQAVKFNGFIKKSPSHCYDLQRISKISINMHDFQLISQYGKKPYNIIKTDWKSKKISNMPFDFKLINHDICIIRNPKVSNNLKLFVFGDSFINNCSEYLNQTFAQVVYLTHRKLNTSGIRFIIKNSPDIVLFESVEREMIHPYWRIFKDEKIFSEALKRKIKKNK